MLNTKEKELTAKFLEMMSDEYSCHGCNDVDESMFEKWTPEERRQFVKEFHDWNGDPETYDENYLHLPDFAIVSFLSYKILK